MIRHGMVVFTPHYITRSGPVICAAIAVEQWTDFDIEPR